MNLMTNFPLSDPLSPWDVLDPVLFNPWKHHAEFLRQCIRAAISGGEPALGELAGQLVVVGTELMDLYTGSLTPAEIAAQVVARLQADDRLEREAYRAWLLGHGGYQVVPFDDGSRWVLRLGDEGGRYVHVHPARWAPQTRRVRANVLKTAVLAAAYAGVHDGDPRDRALLNRVRQTYLGLAPLGKELAENQGIGGVLAVLA
jgi:hypothetical protein